MVKVVRREGREIIVRTPEDDEQLFTFLEVVDRVDQFPDNYSCNPCFKEQVYYLTTHEGEKIGFVLTIVLEEMRKYCHDLVADTFEIKESSKEICFKNHNAEDRNVKIAKIARRMFEQSTFEGIKGWRDERYAVWVKGSPYVLIERAMAGLLGIITYGVHVNGYTVDEATKEFKFWIPRRSATKPTWPLMLDNIVAGGIGYPHGIYDTVIKESVEEATLSQKEIEQRIRSVGVLSYVYFPRDIHVAAFDNESDFIVGEVEYIYDLQLSNDIIPKPNDGEVDSFNLLSLQEVIDSIVKKQFKPNCAIVMTDFLIRHGFLNAENEPNFLTLVNRMHRKLPFSVPN